MTPCPHCHGAGVTAAGDLCDHGEFGGGVGLPDAGDLRIARLEDQLERARAALRLAAKALHCVHPEHNHAHACGWCEECIDPQFTVRDAIGEVLAEADA